MKLNLLSLLSFFAIATITVSGQFLRGDNKDQTADMVNAQKRIEMLMGRNLSSKNETTSALLDEKYNFCERFNSQTGNNFFAKTTNRMGGVVGPNSGCVAVRAKKWNGSEWIPIDNKVQRSCGAEGHNSIIKVSGSRQTNISIDVFEAEGDNYDVEMCWD